MRDPLALVAGGSAPGRVTPEQPRQDAGSRRGEAEASNSEMEVSMERVPDQSSWPAHLRDDAPWQQCIACGRKTWDVAEFGHECLMTQPDGQRCRGMFVDLSPHPDTVR
jgi:hypothetical protein